MRTVTYRLVDLQRAVINMGFVGENECTRIIFDCKKTFDEYPNALPSLTIAAPNGEIYPAAATKDGDFVLWDVTESDLAYEGSGELQLTFTDNNVVVKSYICKTKIARSVIPTGDPPDPVQNWIEEAYDIIDSIPTTINTALQEAKDSGEFDGYSPTVDIQETQTGHEVSVTDVHGTQTFDVVDGVSPIVRVTSIPGGHHVLIKDAEGDHVYDVMDGEKGDPGDDGISPTITVTDITGGHRVTITDVNGTRTIDVMDGLRGADGYSPTATVTKSGKVATISITDKNGTTTATVTDGNDVDPSVIIDDNAGAGDLNKVWSADRTTRELSVKYQKPVTGIPASDLAAGVIPEVPVQDVQIDNQSVIINGVANIPKASADTLGVAKTNTGYGTEMKGAYNELLAVSQASSQQIKAAEQQYKPITPYHQHEAVFYGLAKAAGDITQNESPNPVGNYTEQAKTLIQQMLEVPSVHDIPEVPVQDVQINTTSIVDNLGVARLLHATTDNVGLVRVNNTYGTGMRTFPNNDTIQVVRASNAEVKTGVQEYKPVVPYTEHMATFYGLAKAAGDSTQSLSDNAVGTYTTEAKTAIQTMLDVPAKADIPNVPVHDVSINGQTIVDQNGIAAIPTGSSLVSGVYKVNPAYGTNVNAYGALTTVKATELEIKNSTQDYKPITPSVQDQSVFYGLAKAAGDQTQSESINPVGTYTNDAKAAIRTMLDVPSASDIPLVPVRDVQVNGASVLDNGTANIPVASTNTFGVVKIGSGLNVNSDNLLTTYPASSAQIKTATVQNQPITPYKQHEATFYGLAKAAGDATQASSSNAVGTYTDDAKTAIQTMLDVPSNEDLQEIVAVSDTEPQNDASQIWFPETTPSSVQVPTVAEMQAMADTKTDKVQNAVSGNFAGLDANGNLTDSGYKHSDYVTVSQKGNPNGVAELDANGLIPSAQLPSYVDDILEYDDLAHFPVTGEAGKIYVAKDTNLQYRWSGSTYSEVSKSLALGETDSTAYRGDRGAAAYAAAVTNLDNSPSIGSANLVKSGGVFSALELRAPKASPIFTGSISMGRLGNTTIGSYSVAEGYQVVATAQYSHAEGNYTTARGNSSHVEGYYTVASGNSSHAEGWGHSNSNYGAFGKADHSEGYQTIANSGTNSSSYAAHAEGYITQATNLGAHSEGNNTVASGQSSHAEGNHATASGFYSHAEGYYTTASGSSSHAEGSNTQATSSSAHAEGTYTIASGLYSHAEGYYTTASASFSHAEGQYTKAAGTLQHVMGMYNNISGIRSSEVITLPAIENVEAFDPAKKYYYNGDLVKVNDAIYVCHSLIAPTMRGSPKYDAYHWHIAPESFVPTGNEPYWDVFMTCGNGDAVKVQENGTDVYYVCHSAISNSYIVPGIEDGTVNWHSQPSGSTYTISNIVDQIETVGFGASNTDGRNIRMLNKDGNEYLLGDIYVHCNEDSTGGTKLAKITDIPTVSVDDVQIDGTSIVSNGIATIPTAGAAGIYGVVKLDVGATGVGLNSSGALAVAKATSAQIKAGTNNTNPVAVSLQHESVFYGLAKAAGDSTQSASSNAVGTYTDNAKTAIKDMLSVQEGLEVVRLI